MSKRLASFVVVLALVALGTEATAQSTEALLKAAQRSFAQADAMAEAGRSAEAKRRFDSTLEILDKARTQSPGRTDIDALRAQSLLLNASVCVDLGEKTLARDLFVKAIAAYDELARREPKSDQWKTGAQVARQTLRKIDSFTPRN